MAPTTKAQVETCRLSDHAERREVSRVPGSELTAFDAWLGPGRQAQLLDLSITGARFLASRHMPTGAPVALHLAWAGVDRRVAGRVTRSQESGRDEFEVAVVFDQPLEQPGLPAPRVEASLGPDPSRVGLEPKTARPGVLLTRM